MAQNSKQEPAYDLIQSMSKAEKRNFKLYATRLSGNQEAKFVTLFDCMDTLDEYDETKILQRCPIKKEQLPNLKAHLYKQILVSIRLLDVQHTVQMQLREQIDFARILYDKGLFRQTSKTLEKALDLALLYEQYTTAIEIIEFQRRLSTLDLSSSLISTSNTTSRQIAELCNKITNINELAGIGSQLYALYQQLGYARTQKDLDMIVQLYGPTLARYEHVEKSFMEQVHYLQAQVWYNYIRHDMLTCYKFICRWIVLFDTTPHMKEVMYDNYLRGYSRLLDGLYMLRSYRRFTHKLHQFEEESALLAQTNENAQMISRQIIYTNRINQHFWEGTFDEGIKMVPEIVSYLKHATNYLSPHYKMGLCYKIACLYFGAGNYRKCMEFLNPVICTRDPRIRRDLQCYARILNLISCYEAGIDYNLDYQVRAVCIFLIKMNDMHEVQREIMNFLKRLNSTLYATRMQEELRGLYERLKPLEHHPYERRTFYYLDILSYLESKQRGISVAEVIRQRFLKESERAAITNRKAPSSQSQPRQTRGSRAQIFDNRASGVQKGPSSPPTVHRKRC